MFIFIFMINIFIFIFIYDIYSNAEGMEDSISVHIINASTPDITILPTSFNRINQVLSTPQSSALSLYLNLYM